MSKLVSQKRLHKMIVSINMIFAADNHGDIKVDVDERILWHIISSTIASLLYCSITGKSDLFVDRRFLEREKDVMSLLEKYVKNSLPEDKEKAEQIQVVIAAVYIACRSKINASIANRPVEPIKPN